MAEEKQRAMLTGLTLSLLSLALMSPSFYLAFKLFAILLVQSTPLPSL